MNSRELKMKYRNQPEPTTFQLILTLSLGMLIGIAWLWILV